MYYWSTAPHFMRCYTRMYNRAGFMVYSSRSCSLTVTSLLRKKTESEGKAHFLFWACTLPPVWLHNGSSALGMGLFSDSAKWSIKWEEQTDSAALPQCFCSFNILICFIWNICWPPSIISSFYFCVKPKNSRCMFERCITRFKMLCKVFCKY